MKYVKEQVFDHNLATRCLRSRLPGPGDPESQNCFRFVLLLRVRFAQKARDRHSPFFTARCCASAVLAMGPCLCLSVSVTSRSSTKTAQRRITQTTPHDTPGSVVFWCQRSPRNSTGEGAECRWGDQNRRLSTNNRLYLENGTR